MMNETIKLLAGGISAIIPPEYIGQKLIESGTGILWKKLKKRLEGDNNAVGAGLYDAIEHSVETYANTHTHNKDDIAESKDMEAYYSKEEQDKYGVLGIEIRKK